MTTSFWQSAWVWYGSGLVLGTIGVLLITWALLCDRARGRKRCPKCWYDMSAAVLRTENGEAWACPECGRRGNGERALHRTRRRRAPACLALLLLLAAWLAYEQPVIRRRGWMWLVPTRLLIEALPLEDPDGAIRLQLMRRLGLAAWPGGEYACTMTDDQIASLFEACAHGNPLARPVDARWQKSYGSLVAPALTQIYYRLRLPPGGAPAGLSNDVRCRSERIERAITDICKLHGPLTVRTRDRWPKGMPIHLELPIQTWWYDSHRAWAHVTWTVEGVNAHWDCFWTGSSELTVPGDGHIKLHVKVEWIEGDQDTRDCSAWRVLESASHLLEYDVVPTIDDILKPVASAQLDAQLASAISLNRDGMIDWGGVRAVQAAHPATMSFGLRIEWLLDGRVVAFSRCQFAGGASASASYSGPNFPDVDTWEEARKILQTPNLKARITTDPAYSLYNIDAQTYWKGAADITVKPVK